MKKPIFLVGFMAAGKTSLGRFAAKRLGREFIDLDRYIESRYRQTVSQLFASRGEDGFRIIENNMLHEVAEFDNVLIATGGGTPCYYDNMSYMKENGIVVFLSSSVDVICQRLLVAKVKRPLVEKCTPEELPQVVSAMLDQRMPYYEQAHYTFPSDEYEKATVLALTTEELRKIVSE